MAQTTPALSYKHSLQMLVAMSFVTPFLWAGCASFGSGSGTQSPNTPVLKRVTMAGADIPMFPIPFRAPSSQYVVLTIAAPWPGDVKVSLNGADLERVINNVARERDLADQGIGFFGVDDVDPNPVPAVWRVRISPKPIHQCTLEPFHIRIRHVVGGSESAPLDVFFSPTNSFSVLGTTGRIVMLEWPSCPPVAEFRLERRTMGNPFTSIATLANTGNTFRDAGLTPSTQLQYRLTFVRLRPGGPGMPSTKIEVSSTTRDAATTVLQTGKVSVNAWREDEMHEPHKWKSVTTSLSARPGGVRIDAVITRVQNDGNRGIFVTFEDSNGAQVSNISIPANDSKTTPFEGMSLAGSWFPIKTTGSAIGLPTDSWPMKAFWREP